MPTSVCLVMPKKRFMRDTKPYRKKRNLSQSSVSKWNLDTDGIRRVMWTMFAASLDIRELDK